MMDKKTTAIAKDVISVFKRSGDINRGMAGVIAALATIVVMNKMPLGVLRDLVDYAYDQALTVDDEDPE